MRALMSLLALVSLPVAVSAWAGPLNDTGIDFCRDHTSGTDTTVTGSTTCVPMPGHGGQDARYGRDAAASRGALPKVGAGSKGFDFTKIANNGTTLPANAALGANPTDWACTYDNNTGLMWEVKVNDNSHLRHMDWTYSWYDSAHNYGGNAGAANNGACLAAGRCDTEKYVADVNAATLCGHADWRMPTLNELYNLADRGIAYPGSTIDPTYFPNTLASVFWSGSPAAGVSDYAWNVNFGNGVDYWVSRNNAYRVRLVRAGQ